MVLAQPRGFCAGVVRAISIVERALEKYEAPVFVRHEIVHNKHVVEDLKAKGARFVDEIDEIPPGSVTIFSAHGVAKSVQTAAKTRDLPVIDATCPLVTKVHVQARRFAADCFEIILIGHAGHEEVIGTMGEAPEAITLVESVDDAEALTFPYGTKLAYVTQTTLSVEETAEIIAVLRRRYPYIRSPKREDICYATSNRQRAVKEMLPQIQLLLVIGSKNSSNSNRLVDVARAGGIDAHLIEDAAAIEESWLEQVETVGITSGASAPERLVEGVCDWFRERGVDEIEQARIVEEHVEFRLPVELRRELRARDER